MSEEQQNSSMCFFVPVLGLSPGSRALRTADRCASEPVPHGDRKRCGVRYPGLKGTIMNDTIRISPEALAEAAEESVRDNLGLRPTTYANYGPRGPYPDQRECPSWC